MKSPKKKILKKSRSRLKGRIQHSSSRQYLVSRDFSDVEDSEDAFEIIKELAATAGKSAAAEAKAAGLPRTFVRDNSIILQYPDGKEEIIDSRLPDINVFFFSVNPGKILHARKK
ncbi:MAG: hypothetical protein P0Y53_03650 [Candidatus Pseudobacter hemicellulosilyticus]|uniref:Uncharacterized protein n=1 Tax=Candidatus Pseudobacter hemicellulosilyticus TaxID=3121375 RepID=A0AAJ5WYG4_9BACT|nr:MAG: hypothetical protein P0Y53_03650 [Pseudobacter sp.]